MVYNSISAIVLDRSDKNIKDIINDIKTRKFEVFMLELRETAYPILELSDFRPQFNLFKSLLMAMYMKNDITYMSTRTDDDGKGIECTLEDRVLVNFGRGFIVPAGILHENCWVYNPIVFTAHGDSADNIKIPNIPFEIDSYIDLTKGITIGNFVGMYTIEEYIKEFIRKEDSKDGKVFNELLSEEANGDNETDSGRVEPDSPNKAE